MSMNEAFLSMINILHEYERSVLKYDKYSSSMNEAFLSMINILHEYERSVLKYDKYSS